MLFKKIISKIGICLLLIINCGNASIKYEEGFDIASSYFKIDKTILKIIAKNESKFNQYAILLKTSKKSKISKFLKREKIKHLISEKYISIFPSTINEARSVYENVIKNNSAGTVDYDLGLMQVNRLNFKRYDVNELDYYLDYRKNIFLGADVLRKCYNRFKTAQDAIECYHRGTDNERFKKNDYSYFVRFTNQYQRTYGLGK